MIQRKQSIYLFFAALVSGISTWVADLWKLTNEWIQPEDNIETILFFGISALLSLTTIFLYKSRKLQMRLNGLNVILNILLIGYLAYGLSNLPGGFSDSEKGIGLLVPFISIVLLFIANRFIKKDEKLVKSVDRFR
ncbi:DUF4293 domain-containing protein [Moheibacter lacus]|uniref:DUF4293 domain-containing protein n=1 Tax=Moheibacter lacus TaxID=2745851 RepID=A0A838ZPN2_9FLAO|nr:DUF4293 domain-containing protein [Moheibacter lacus]MBA5629467.1 DUF4293 domain-containing protein [Moheibacter lacus]